MVTFQDTPQDSRLRYTYEANRRKQAEDWYFAIRYFIRETDDIASSRKWLDAYIAEYGYGHYVAWLEETLNQIKSNNTQSQKKETAMSKIGHILTVRHYNALAHRFENFHYPIIGVKFDRFKRAYYFIPTWNKYTNDFHCYYQDSTFMVSVSENAMPMSEAHKAAARAFRYGRILGLLERLRQDYNSPSYRIEKASVAAPNLGYPNRMVVGDDYEYKELESDEAMLKRIAAKKRYYMALRHEGMVLAGIFNEAK